MARCSIMGFQRPSVIEMQLVPYLGRGSPCEGGGSGQANPVGAVDVCNAF